MNAMSVLNSSSSSVNLSNGTTSNRTGDGSTLSDLSRMLILTSMIFIDVSAFFGNLLIICAFFRTRRLQTVTNYFIASLAFADALVAIFVLPLSIYYYQRDRSWQLGLILCDLWVSSDVLLCTSSILNLTCISVDRYMAITKPLTYTAYRSKFLARVMILLVWIVSAVITCPPILGWRDVNRRQTVRRVENDWRQRENEYSSTIFAGRGRVSMWSEQCTRLRPILGTRLILYSRCGDDIRLHSDLHGCLRSRESDQKLSTESIVDEFDQICPEWSAAQDRFLQQAKQAAQIELLFMLSSVVGSCSIDEQISSSMHIQSRSSCRTETERISGLSFHQSHSSFCVSARSSRRRRCHVEIENFDLLSDTSKSFEQTTRSHLRRTLSVSTRVSRSSGSRLSTAQWRISLLWISNLRHFSVTSIQMSITLIWTIDAEQNTWSQHRVKS